MVKITAGQFKGYIGPIRHCYKNYLFLWNKDFVQSNGIFVENAGNVVILGAEFVKGSKAQAISNQNKMGRHPMVGKTIIVIRGKFKGHRGRVTYANDKPAIVELSSQCKKVPIDIDLIKLLDNPEDAAANEGGFDGRSQHGGASVYGGATVYDGGKTPGGGINTPSYYP